MIPAYNESENIADCLNSLRVQIRPPDEVIVVDNESEDDTMEIARSFGVKVLSFPRPYQRHGNIGLVRQKGTEEANGDIVVSTDADTTHPEDWLQKIESLFVANPDLVLLGGPVYNSERDRDLLNDLLCGISNFNRSYWAGWGVPIFLAANTSFRRDAFMSTEGYKGAGGHGPVEEWVIAFRLSRVGEWLWSNSVYCYTRVPDWVRAYFVALPLSTAPLQTWMTLATLQGLML